MFENANKEVARELAQKTMRSHRLRNIMSILAIALTTLLITTIVTVGVTLTGTLDRATDTTPAPLADGGVKAPVSAYEQVLALEQVEWAGYVRPCNLGSLHNREAIGIQALLLAPNEEFLTRNDVKLAEGRFPEAADEIAISSTMAERLDSGIGVGSSYVLKPVVWENGEQVEKEIPVTIVGLFTSPIEALSSIYEEIYTAEAFLDAFAPGMKAEDATIYLQFRDSGNRGWIGDELQAISDQVGGSGTVYRLKSSSASTTLPAVILLLVLVMVCGYLLIYNVFYISIVNDIRFFGMLKTIGTSGRQLKSLLSWQTIRLAAVGIAIGLISGYVVGVFATPAVLSFTDFGSFYRRSFSPLIFLAAAAFSALTVLISCRKPYRIAVRVSPVEASRYRDKGATRKKVLSVISFALSGVIFLVVFTVSIGYDVEAQVDRVISSDVKIRQDTMLYPNEENYQPISRELIGALDSLPFIKDTVLYYEAREIDREQAGASDAFGQMKMAEGLRQEYDRLANDRPGWISQAENGDLTMRIAGFPADQLHREEPNIRLLEGSLDEERFASGGYLIYNPGTSRHDAPNHTLHPGTRLQLSLYDPDRDVYTDKEFEVMAVVGRASPFPVSLMAQPAIIIADSDFKEIYPLYEDLIGNVLLDATHELTEEEYRQVEEIVQGSFNSQITLSSRFTDRQDARKRKISLTLLGLFLSGVFGLIGACNIVNTQVTDILARKLEYATMQSIGMTKRQMSRSIRSSNFLLCAVSVALSIPAGLVMTGGVSGVLFETEIISIPYFIIGCLILLAAMCVISFCTAAILTRFLNRKPVVERLREAE